ncbi:hypothetical protein [Parerythrobacter lacustris]|uniref:Uncharacterized protein n=1 Tax=Parerythrobacter lacustris TaxID=2969984 RepID=A0ABT1XP71_9SPHN|nr:hypothetical protein [Parerythrobacter lacustris]MCR2833466.1 hypothetical protein [Parerythrobacter lacustris]
MIDLNDPLSVRQASRRNRKTRLRKLAFPETRPTDIANADAAIDGPDAGDDGDGVRDNAGEGCAVSDLKTEQWSKA